jgi:hypothetical protein
MRLVELSSWQRHKSLSLEYKRLARTVGRADLVGFVVELQRQTDPWSAMSAAINRKN